MSSILSALRRLEDDKRPDEEETELRESVVLPALPKRGAPAWVLPVIVFAVAAAGLALVYGLSAPESEKAPAAVAARAGSGVTDPGPVVTSSGARESALLPASSRGASALAPAASSRLAPALLSAPSPPAPALAAAAAPPVSPASVQRPESRVVDPVVARRPRRTPVAAIEAPPIPSSPPSVSPPVGAEVNPRVSTPVDAEVNPRVSTPVDAEVNPRVSTPVGVERILWHPVSAKRRAWLQLDGADKARVVREGDEVGNFSVEEIDAGSVLFRSGAIEIRYKLGAKR